MALVDAGYKFIFVDIGANGSCADNRIFEESGLPEALKINSINIPAPEALPSDEQPIPYSVIGDDAFPLRPWLMKPYPSRGLTTEQRIFNYRLFRARRVVENAFGILAHRFRCLLTTMQQHPSRIEKIVMACCVLHKSIKNPRITLAMADREEPRTQQVIGGEWRNDKTITEYKGYQETHLF